MSTFFSYIFPIINKKRKITKLKPKKRYLHLICNQKPSMIEKIRANLKPEFVYTLHIYIKTNKN